jgi:hypothetical protein
MYWFRGERQFNLRTSYTLTPCPFRNIYQIIEKNIIQNPTRTKNEIIGAISETQCIE